MKYDEFAALCGREWDGTAAGQVVFGNVTALNLTDASHWELHSSYHASRGILCSLGPLVPHLPNPVTGSDVTVTGGAEADTATVSFGTFAWAPPPRTVALA